jgi:hypothetical protein
MPGLSRIKQSDFKQEQKETKIIQLQAELTRLSLFKLKFQTRADLASSPTEIVGMGLSHCVHQFVKFEIHKI